MYGDSPLLSSKQPKIQAPPPDPSGRKKLTMSPKYYFFRRIFDRKTFMPILLFYLAVLFLSESVLLVRCDEVQILLELKKSLGVSDKSWTPNNSPCRFAGVTCTTTKSVSAIDLTNKTLTGYLSFDTICQLSSLQKLSLGYNDLSGPITPSLNNCAKLQHLDLAFNSLIGHIPDFSSLTDLRVLNLSDNAFTGPFPWTSLHNTTKLTDFLIGDNPSLEPSLFPEEVTSLLSLTMLYLSNCSLLGPIPPSIGNLTELVDLELSGNSLTGHIPQEITRLTKLFQLELWENQLTGTIPPGFRNLTELAKLDFSSNSLGGDLTELKNLTKLHSLQLLYNQFSGEVPVEFGDFDNLVELSIYSNMFHGQLPQNLGSKSDFDFIDASTNSFTGPIPPNMCRLGKMTYMALLENQFTGEIPASYASCTTLTRFRVSNNSLTGKVPPGLWGLPQVDILDLEMNGFEGLITPDIGRAASLTRLLIANNRFSGQLPPQISVLDSLVQLRAQNNRFSGVIPPGISNLTRLTMLYLQRNLFSGPITASLGLCTSLNDLNLAGNRLSGGIPSSLGSLPSLNFLNLSNNQLSGQIPQSLSSLRLSLLDLSNNDLTGQIPNNLFALAYNGSFDGNPGLCGQDIESLSPCSTKSSKSNEIRKLVSCFMVGIALLLASVACYIVFKRKRSSVDERSSKFGKRESSLKEGSWDLKSFQVLSFTEDDIIDAIKVENMIGQGGSGNVYRVDLDNGVSLAVKHIWNSPESSEPSYHSTSSILKKRPERAAMKEFEAEVAALSSIRHVNVVKLYCSISSEDSNMLVYEFLPNGSLWDRLHTCKKKLELDWETRYEIALGAAKGLEYLHHGCERPILHRDVKSSNILLDEMFKPRIADFGLAKITQAGNQHRIAGKDSTHVIAGTHGYIAPEYAYTYKVNEKSDVYSFGVVIMELVTGKKPIEPEFGDNKDIVFWIFSRMTNRENLLSVVDPKIPEHLREDAIKVLRIGVLCTARLPALRPSMRTVVHMLEDAGPLGSVLIDIRDEKKPSQVDK